MTESSSATGTTISILGCGWLGLPLGAHLAARGHRVKGSTTISEKMPALEEVGIEPFLIEVDAEGLRGVQVEDFFRADVLFLNIPPGRRRPDVADRYPAQIAAVRRAVEAAPVRLVVFASSTSVYPESNRVVREQDAGGAPTDSGRALLEAEHLLAEADGFRTTVLRFGGLYGYDRRPGRFLAGRKKVSGGDAPVNLIHRDDCVEIAAALIEGAGRGEVFNAVSDAHPTRRAFYTRAAEHLGLEPPSFVEGPTPFKIVSNERLKTRLGYRFRHPDPMEAFEVRSSES